MSLFVACSDVLLTTGACHGTTAFIGCKACRARQAARCAGAVGRGPALRSGSAAAGLAGRNAGTDGRCPRYRSRDGGPMPGEGAKTLDAPGAIGSVVGWSPASSDERAGGA